MDAGLLVPDSIIIGLIVERLDKSDAISGVLFDGFPRTIPQAEALESVAKVVAVVSIEVPDDAIISRIVGRRMDPQTGDIYHVEFNPAPSPKIEERLVQRKDDTEDTVRARLLAYHEQTAPLADWYSEKGLLFPVNGNGSIEDVAESISDSLGDI
jgi:adenylate kinase